jgi:hypothetical protein
MIRRICPLIAALTLGGCFDFDGAYATYCDGGRCIEGTGGGSTISTGGGTGAVGGGTATGGGTTTGGGTATGGGNSTGGGTATGGGIAGCGAPLCPTVDYVSSDWGQYPDVARGLMGQSVDRFDAWASFDTSASGGSTFTHFVYKFVDGGVTPIDRTSKLSTTFEAEMLRGVSMSDQWFVFRGGAAHLEGPVNTRHYGCSQSDGGVSSPYHYAVVPVSSDEAWLTGIGTNYDLSICHWRRDAGLALEVPEGLYTNAYFYDAYRTSSGVLYIAGVSATGVPLIVRGDGSQVMTPAYPADTSSYGFTAMAGLGNDAYALFGSNPSGVGEILKLQSDGSFASIYTAPFKLRAFAVAPNGHLWAIGDANDTVLTFDGVTWQQVTLPLTVARGTITFEAIAAFADGIALTGNEQGDAGRRRVAIVNAYRFGP